MFCQNCGEPLNEKARFCSNCGEKVIEQAIEKEPSPIEVENETMVESEVAATAESPLPQQNEKRVKRIQRTFKKGPLLIPVISLLLVCSGVSAAYYHETNKNEEVLHLQQAAEQAALSGEYSKAEEQLEQALHIRPAYSVLEQNLEAVRRASVYTAELAAITDQMRKQEFLDAEASLFSLKEAIGQEVDPLFEGFSELLTAKEVTIAVGKIKQELSELTTVSQLADKLNRLATLSTEEAAAVKEQILTKMVQISSEQAQQQLENKQFSAAIATINQALEYVRDHQTLLSFKEKIEQERNAFEQAEQNRLEQALEAAAQEELQNQTAAVEVISFDYEVDEFGDLYVSGEIKNVATKDISAVTIEYAVYDVEGEHLYDGSTTVYPYYIGRGEPGSFEDTVFYLFEEVDVEIENISWYVE
ncbi:FxLYD domain-containing protein [Halalkalibacter krulwichiae]|uniref:Zinc-ribbon domain-containing protein n=1 Tax=Halalkalibacter krulwichiae TaxID=199441 RepID=A0A1X9MFR1_9BACI|nr:FxLYD domain-containing protein [Halalkalibacter krulwichiae]ARK32295.1 hypothetical protein BkAM31D_21890 [Halalkalibacter krulwichiae]